MHHLSSDSVFRGVNLTSALLQPFRPSQSSRLLFLLLSMRLVLYSVCPGAAWTPTFLKPSTAPPFTILRLKAYLHRRCYPVFLFSVSRYQGWLLKTVQLILFKKLRSSTLAARQFKPSPTVDVSLLPTTRSPNLYNS